MIAHEKSIRDNPESFVSTEPNSSAVGLKTFFFILLSLNVVFFLWEYHDRGNSRSRNELLLRQKPDPSIDRIVLVGENQESKGAFETARKGLPALNLPSRTDAPPIFESVNQQLSKSIAKSADSLVENLLDSESAKQIDNFRIEKFSELDFISALRYPKNFDEPCCSELQVRLRFRAFDETSIKTDLDQKPQEADSASGPELSDLDHTSASNLVANRESTEIPDETSHKMCFKLGPRFSDADFSSIARDLESIGVETLVKTETIEVDTAFMVIYPAEKSFEASQANVKILKQKGLKDQDLWLISKGEMRGDISLGLFKSHDRAEFRRKELEKEGVHARIKPKQSKRRAYFLFIPSSAPTTAIHARVLQADFEASELKNTEPAACAN